MITGILMASGFSKRMGQNKLLLEYRGSPIFKHAIKSMLSSNLDNIIVVTNNTQIIEHCTNNSIRFVENNNPELGQSNSLKLGVSHSPKDSSFMFFVADQPLLKPSVINELIDKSKEFKEKIIVPVNNNNPSSPTIFPNWLRDDLLKTAGDVGGKHIIKQNQSHVEYVQIKDQLSLFDIDTLDDYKKIIE